MKMTHLSVSFINGKALVAYLYLPRRARDKSVRTRRVPGSLIIDFAADGRALGVEILDPQRVTLTAMNRALRAVGAEPITRKDLAPLRAA